MIITINLIYTGPRSQQEETQTPISKVFQMKKFLKPTGLNI